MSLKYILNEECRHYHWTHPDIGIVHVKVSHPEWIQDREDDTCHVIADRDGYVHRIPAPGQFGCEMAVIYKNGSIIRYTGPEMCPAEAIPPENPPLDASLLIKALRNATHDQLEEIRRILGVCTVSPLFPTTPFVWGDPKITCCSGMHQQ